MDQNKLEDEAQYISVDNEYGGDKPIIDPVTKSPSIVCSFQ